MDERQLAIWKDQFNDLFRIDHKIPINIKPIEPIDLEEQTFIAMMPEPFKMASDMATLDKSMARSLSRISDIPNDLLDYLRLQSRKIDSLMRFMLMQQDDPNFRVFSESYGGSALVFVREQPLEVGALIEVKLFLEHNNGAVYAWARVIDCQVHAHGHLVRATYTHIIDDDREAVVRASLHEQSRQLKRKAEQRQLQGNL